MCNMYVYAGISISGVFYCIAVTINVAIRLKSIMLLNLPIILSGNSQTSKIHLHIIPEIIPIFIMAFLFILVSQLSETL